MGQSNQVRWAYVVEVTPGTTPATPTMKILRRTGGRMKSPLEIVKSNEVRSDRNIAGVYEVGRTVDGSMEFELSYGSMDDFLAAAMFGAWSTVVNFSGGVTITAASGTVAATGAFTNVVVGQWIQIGGMTTAANNGYFKVLTRADADTVTVDDPDGVLVDEVDAAATIKSGGMLRNGSTVSAFSIEEGHLDNDDYFLFKGMHLGAAKFSIRAGELVTGSFDFVGMGVADPSGTEVGSSYTAANSNKVFNATSNFYALLEGGAAPADDLMEISLDFTNNLKALKFVGDRYAAKVNPGSFVVTGNLNFYANGYSLVTKFLNATETSVSFRLTDAAGNTLIVTIPSYIYTGDGFPEPGGLDGETTLSLPFEAYYNSTHGCTLQFDRFAA